MVAAGRGWVTAGESGQDERAAAFLSGRCIARFIDVVRGKALFGRDRGNGKSGTWQGGRGVPCVSLPILTVPSFFPFQFSMQALAVLTAVCFSCSNECSRKNLQDARELTKNHTMYSALEISLVSR